MKLKSHKAMVTGGTRGIGAAIAIQLLREGAEVLTIGRNPSHHPPEGCQYRQVDFADAASLDKFVTEIGGMGIDILINNTGINKIAPFEQIEIDDFERIQRVNLHAPVRLIQALLPGMRQKKWGRIVNITSVFGIVSRENRASYSASKFGLDGMTVALAAEIAVDGILANCVAPGFIDTDMTRTILGEQGISEIKKRIPAGRLGRPAEVATFVAWLVSPDNTYLTGQNIAIDGGFSRV